MTTYRCASPDLAYLVRTGLLITVCVIIGALLARKHESRKAAC